MQCLEESESSNETEGVLRDEIRRLQHEIAEKSAANDRLQRQLDEHRYILTCTIHVV